MKIDPYHNKEYYLGWKERVKSGIPEISPENSQIILQYLNDMEKGINVSSTSVKGARSYLRLNSLKSRLIRFSKSFSELYGLTKITDVSEEQIISFFADMRNGTLPKRARANIL